MFRIQIKVPVLAAHYGHSAAARTAIRKPCHPKCVDVKALMIQGCLGLHFIVISVVLECCGW